MVSVVVEGTGGQVGRDRRIAGEETVLIELELRRLGQIGGTADPGDEVVGSDERAGRSTHDDGTPCHRAGREVDHHRLREVRRERGLDPRGRGWWDHGCLAAGDGVVAEGNRSALVGIEAPAAAPAGAVHNMNFDVSHPPRQGRVTETRGVDRQRKDVIRDIWVSPEDERPAGLGRGVVIQWIPLHLQRIADVGHGIRDAEGQHGVTLEVVACPSLAGTALIV